MIARLINILPLPVLGTLLVFAVFYSCEEPPVVFSQPQPKDIEESFYIQPIYRGVFLCESDSAKVHINGRTIYKEKTFEMALSPEDIAVEPSLQLVDTLLFIEEIPEPLSIRYQQDSIRATITLRDTLFHLGNNQVVKYFRGHQIINKRLPGNKWGVYVMSLDYDLNLIWSEAEMPEDLEMLEKITPVRDISVEDKKQIIINPELVEFDEILNLELIFQTCDQFTRLHMPVEM